MGGINSHEVECKYIIRVKVLTPEWQAARAAESPSRRIKTSSTDLRENTVISGHAEIRTLYEANNVVYPESVCVNMINAPGNSTTQCDCGHINCPFCNLMMNLELTDPSVLK